VNNHLMASRSRSGRPIPFEARLACALRYFAGGDPIDLKLIYCMSKPQIMLCVWRAVDAINLCLDNIIFPIDDIHRRWVSWSATFVLAPEVAFGRDRLEPSMESTSR
jgi:hypothetical protein